MSEFIGCWSDDQAAGIAMRQAFFDSMRRPTTKAELFDAWIADGSDQTWEEFCRAQLDDRAGIGRSPFVSFWIDR